MKRAIWAIGGNSLLNLEGSGGKSLKPTIEGIVYLIKQGYDLVITHGNGPQVGNLFLAFEEVDIPLNLDEADAYTQGFMGYLIQRELRNALVKTGIEVDVVTVLTQVIVDPNDPAFGKPTKPIGRFYSREEADRLARSRGWHMMFDAHRGYRRVVPSPEPKSIVEIDAIRELLDKGYIVIAGGGGGIPVIETTEGLQGVNAVIDKDLLSALMGQLIGASLFVITTSIDRVYINFHKPNQLPLREVTTDKLRKYLADGHFGEGSMAPKIRAAIRFIESGGDRVVITSPEKVIPAIDGREGTHIIGTGVHLVKR